LKTLYFADMESGGLKEEVQALEGLISDLLARKAAPSGAVLPGGVALSPARDPSATAPGLSRLADALESTGVSAAGQPGGADIAEAAELIRRAVARLRELG
jgi:hypothetical protein